MQSIFHHTSLAHALSILKSEVFISAVNTPTRGDSGMNCYCAKEPTARNMHNGNGAIIEFTWAGRETDNDEKMLEPEWLVHFGAWRSVVTLGSKQNLMAVDLHVKNQEHWREYILCTPRPPSVMGRASVKGFRQVKNPSEDLILHRVLRHKFRSLLFLFHCIRTSGLRDTPYPGFVLPSVVSLKAATLCLVQIWSWVPIFPAYSAVADNLRASV